MTSNLRPKPDRRKKTTTSAGAAIAAPDAPAISQAEIARKAYELYCARGGQHGSALDDWLSAERELSSASVVSASASAADQPRRRTVRRTANAG